MSGPQTTGRAQQISRKAMIAHLTERGWTPSQIADELNCSVQAVNYHLRSLEQIWLDQILVDISMIKARKVAELASLKRAAWTSYDISLGNDMPLVAGSADADAYDITEDSGVNPDMEVDLADADGNEIIDVNARDELLDDAEVLDDVTKVLRQRADDPRPQHGPSASDFAQGRVPFTVDNVRHFQSAGEQRLHDLRERQRRGSVTLSPRRDYHVKQMPAKLGGEPAFLKIILDAIERESMILGLDAPKRTVDLRLTPQMIREMGDDDLEKMIAKLGGEQLLEDLTAVSLADSIDKTRQNTGIVEERDGGVTEADRIRGSRADRDGRSE